MRELLRRIRFLFHRAEFERDPKEEMRHHLANGSVVLILQLPADH
jgi:hypothetical protein